MQGREPAYFTAYRSVKLTRDTQGVLIMEFHSDGGPLTFRASDHTLAHPESAFVNGENLTVDGGWNA
jgi:NAD(P)-dependent dehydrogenase (short-subunit alcohol dehydrogenase family)